MVANVALAAAPVKASSILLSSFFVSVYDTHSVHTRDSGSRQGARDVGVALSAERAR